MYCCVGWRQRAVRCATPILTLQTSQKLPSASVSPSWSASARLIKRHLARPHRSLSNTFPECDPQLWELSPFLHSWRGNTRFSLALAKAMWSEAKTGNIPLPARDAGDPRREIHEARKRNPERVWYDTISLQHVVKEVAREEDRGRIAKRIEKAQAKSTPEFIYPKLVQEQGVVPRIMDDPPLLFHPTAEQTPEVEGGYKDGFAMYRESIPEHVRTLFHQITQGEAVK